MNILRRMFIGILSLILSSTLFLAAWSSVSAATIHNRQSVKNWLVDSKFYDHAFDSVLEKVADSSKQSSGSLPVNDPAIQKIARQTFSPDFLKKNAETVLDSTYDWLDGTKPDVNFKIDLTDAKQQLATGLGKYVAERSAKLPACQTRQVRENFDAFSATCRPVGASPEQLGTTFSSEFLQQDFLKNPVLSSADLKIKNLDGTTSSIGQNDAANSVKNLYQKSTSLPYILIITSILLALGIVFMSSTRIKGIRRVGYLFTGNGIFLLIAYLFLGPGVQAIGRKLSKTDEVSQKTATLAIDFTKVVAQNIRQALLWYVVGYLLLGIGCYVAAHTLRKQSTQNELDKKTETPIKTALDDAPTEQNIAVASNPVENKEN